MNTLLNISLISTYKGAYTFSASFILLKGQSAYFKCETLSCESANLSIFKNWKHHGNRIGTGETTRISMTF